MHSVEKTLKDLGDKVSGEERAAVESALSDVRSALKGDDKDVIARKTEALAQASAKIAERAYAKRRVQQVAQARSRAVLREPVRPVPAPGVRRTTWSTPNSKRSRTRIAAPRKRYPWVDNNAAALGPPWARARRL